MLAQLCASYSREFDSIINKNQRSTAAIVASVSSSTPRKRFPSDEDEGIYDQKNEEEDIVETKLKLKKKKKKLKKKKFKKSNKHTLKRLAEVGGDDDYNDEMNDENLIDRPEHASKRPKLDDERGHGLRKSQFEILANSNSKPMLPPPPPLSLNSNILCCAWRIESGGQCGLRFETSDALNEHIKLHMTSTLFNHMEYYQQMKRRLFLEQQQARPASYPPPPGI
jgi:hypothetical protein